MRARSKYEKLRKAYQVIAKYRRGNNLKSANAKIKEIDKLLSYKGKKGKILDILEKVSIKYPSIIPEGIKRSILVESLYKKFARKKPIREADVYEFLAQKYNYRSAKELDRILATKFTDIVWFLFSSTMLYIDGGISYDDYYDAKSHTGLPGVADTFKFADKRNKKKIRSRIIKLLKGDIVRIESNNKALVRKSIDIYSGQMQEYHEELKQHLKGKESPFSSFGYVGVELKDNKAIITYHLEDSGIAPEAGAQPKPPGPTEPPSAPKPLVPPSLPGEIDKQIELKKAEIELEKSKTARLTAESKKMEMLQQTIKIMKSIGASDSQIQKILGI